MAERVGAQKLTVDSIFNSTLFDETGVRQPRWMADGRRLAFLDAWPDSQRTAIWMRDTDTGEAQPLFDPSILTPAGEAKPWDIHAPVWFTDETRLLFTRRAPARFQPCGDLLLANADGSAVRRLTRSSADQRHPRVAPDGRHVSLVRANEIWLIDVATGEGRQLTSGSSRTVYNGRCGWVYEEELGLACATWWSPDSRHIAFLQQDESDVPQVLLTRFDDLHGRPRATRYPKAGDPNPQVRLGVIEVDSGTIRWFDHASQKDDYIAHVQWTPDGAGLLIQRIPRLQNTLDLIRIDLLSGEARLVVSEEDDAWVDHPGELRFLADGTRFIWPSDRSGWQHLYLASLEEGVLGAITSGEWEADGCLAVDEAAGTVIVRAALPDPTRRTLWRCPLAGGELEPLCTEPGVHSASFTPDGRRFVHSWSDLNTPGCTVIRRADGALLTTLIACWSPGVRALGLGPLARPARPARPLWELITFTTSDGTMLRGRLLKPRGFDPSRRYPVLMHTYGGPGSQVVMDSWGGKGGLWYQLLAEMGIGVFMTDNRGTGGRGRDFRKCTYLHLGKWEVHDQIEGARYLAGLSWVDPARIGIWGWSYGGFMASLCILKGADTFRAAIAVAPVTDYRLYDTIYTERYMRTPADNPDGYDDDAPVNHAAKLKGAFLLVHGTMDDNVHFQNAARLATALQDENRPFETMYYPGKHHGIEGRHPHLYAMMTDFLRRRLQGRSA